MKLSTFMASAVAAALGPWVFAFVYFFAQSVILLQQGGTFQTLFANFVAASAYATLAVLVAAVILKGFDR